ncbi:MAG: FAD-dependent oxidoreductase [Gemmatales bacterium]|nr:FAD-dependent oxidoreductase [Gemmatales bacterium]
MREEMWQRLQGEFDLLVIGGGATGAGVALEATLRGLRVALVERYDFSEGTSSRSTKLIHGGIRYLELALRSADGRHLRLVYEALAERRRILGSAPHLCRRLWIVVPCRHWREWSYYSAGVQLYDLLAGQYRLARPRYFSAEAVALRGLGLTAPAGGVAFTDGQFDDARLNWTLIRTAIAFGAVAMNHVAVVALQKVGGRVRAARVRDRWTGEEREIAARVVVNAAGPFADEVRRLVDASAEPMLQPSAGAHLVLRPRQPLPSLGVLIPRTEDGRVVFVLPWYGHWLVGTTDVACAVVERPRVSDEETDYLLRQIRPYLSEVAALPITARWSGIRPLLRDNVRSTAQALRQHRIEDLQGLVTIVGGKWTTYRLMAEELLDWLAERGLRMRRSRSPAVPLFGSPRWATGLSPESATKDRTRISEGRIADYATSAPDDVREHLLQYGTEAAVVGRLAQEYPGRLLEAWPFLRAEVVYATRFEMARTPMDFLARRIRLAFLDTQAAKSAVPEVTGLMAAELGWDTNTCLVMEAKALEQLMNAL